jgi:ribonuclease P protein component
LAVVRSSGGLFSVSIPEGMSDEAHFSAQQPRPRTPARIPPADVDGGWSCRDSRPSRSRPGQAVRLTTITRRADFVAANAGKRAAMPGFVLLVRDRGDGNPAPRLGITVTKKIGNAVVRNRMKRRLRALAREILDAPAVAGADHILIGRNGGIERDYALLGTELAKAVGKLTR